MKEFISKWNITFWTVAINLIVTIAVFTLFNFHIVKWWGLALLLFAFVFSIFEAIYFDKTNHAYDYLLKSLNKQMDDIEEIHNKLGDLLKKIEDD